MDISKIPYELLVRIADRDTELQRNFDYAVARRDKLKIEIEHLQTEKQAMEKMIEKCYDRAAEQGCSWAL